MSLPVDLEDPRLFSASKPRPNLRMRLDVWVSFQPFSEIMLIPSNHKRVTIHLHRLLSANDYWDLQKVHIQAVYDLRKHVDSVRLQSPIDELRRQMNR